MVNPNIKKKTDDIRNKVYGREVRESLASGLEEMSSDVVETVGRQDEVESQWQNVVDETTGKDVISAPEIIAARDGEANLKARLDKENQEVTTQLEQTNYLLTSFGAVGDGVTDDSQAFIDAIDTIEENGGGVLKIPKGVYYVSEGDPRCTVKQNGEPRNLFKIPSNIIIEGYGSSSVILVDSNRIGLFTHRGDVGGVFSNEGFGKNKIDTFIARNFKMVWTDITVPGDYINGQFIRIEKNDNEQHGFISVYECEFENNGGHQHINAQGAKRFIGHSNHFENYGSNVNPNATDHSVFYVNADKASFYGNVGRNAVRDVGGRGGTFIEVHGVNIDVYNNDVKRISRFMNIAPMANDIEQVNVHDNVSKDITSFICNWGSLDYTILNESVYNNQIELLADTPASREGFIVRDYGAGASASNAKQGNTIDVYNNHVVGKYDEQLIETEIGNTTGLYFTDLMHFEEYSFKDNTIKNTRRGAFTIRPTGKTKRIEVKNNKFLNVCDRMPGNGTSRGILRRYALYFNLEPDTDLTGGRIVIENNEIEHANMTKTEGTEYNTGIGFRFALPKNNTDFDMSFKHNKMINIEGDDFTLPGSSFDILGTIEMEHRHTTLNPNETYRGYYTMTDLFRGALPFLTIGSRLTFDEGGELVVIGHRKAIVKDYLDSSISEVAEKYTLNVPSGSVFERRVPVVGETYQWRTTTSGTAEIVL